MAQITSRRRSKGFRMAAQLIAPQIRQGAEKRGFAVARLLTEWREIVGPEMAGMTRPLRVSYAKSGMGATLVLLVSGARAPLIQMQADVIRARVNACYGYNAITRISLTQTAPQGFAEGQADFAHAPRRKDAPPAPAALAEAERVAAGFGDPRLAEAARRLTLNHLSRDARSPNRKV